ncbi:MAG: phytanoyl-CoA dioxygenase family protein [Gammaproteobacteria bacterium]|nr:phytanoyl-CoA dioxygenase family protein [Gammaproteobacteria bacterium]
MTPSTTKLDLDAFDRDGIVWPILAIPGGPASGLERKYRHFQQEMTRVRGRECHLKPHLVSTWLDGIAHDPVVLDAVEAVIGPDILLWSSDFAVKGAGQGTWVPWHQDTPYWNLSTTRVVSVFLAISATTSANGAMKVVPGSHKSGALGQLNFDGDPHEGIARGERKSSEGNLFFYDHIMDVEVDESLARDVELEPGEFSIHHIELLHGGGPNESDHDRIGFVLRYISADTYCRSSKDSAMLVRGSYAGDHFELEPRPAEDFSPEAMQALERAVSFPSGFGDRDMTTGDLQG